MNKLNISLKSLQTGLSKTIEFEYSENKINFYIGPSGIGKTITMLALGGLLDKTQWKCDPIDNFVTTKKISYIFQEPKSFLDPSRIIKKQLQDIVIINQGKYTEQLITNVLKEVNLPEDIKNKYPYQISGGERQRVMLAMAKCKGNSDLLIADEPTSSLDFYNQDIIIKLLNYHFQKNIFKTVFIVTHDRYLVSKYLKEWPFDTVAYEFQNSNTIKKNADEILKNTKEKYAEMIKGIYSPSDNILSESFQIKSLKITNKNEIKSKRFSIPNINFSIHRGEIVGLLGASGCGKTTIIMGLAGLLSIKNWEINMTFKPSVTQIILQDSDKSFNPKLTVKETLLETFRIHNIKQPQKNWLNNLLQLIFSNPKNMNFNARTPQLSGGQKQRLSFIRANEANPKFILADEPFSRLDLDTKFAMMKLLRDKQKEKKTAYLIASHDLITSALLCDKIIYLTKKSNITTSTCIFKKNIETFTWESDCQKELDKKIQMELNKIVNFFLGRPDKKNKKKKHAKEKITSHEQGYYIDYVKKFFINKINIGKLRTDCKSIKYILQQNDQHGEKKISKDHQQDEENKQLKKTAFFYKNSTNNYN